VRNTSIRGNIGIYHSIGKSAYHFALSLPYVISSAVKNQNQITASNTPATPVNKTLLETSLFE
jgi:hypothetical protein